VDHTPSRDAPGDWACVPPASIDTDQGTGGTRTSSSALAGTWPAVAQWCMRRAGRESPSRELRRTTRILHEGPRRPGPPTMTAGLQHHGTRWGQGIRRHHSRVAGVGWRDRSRPALAGVTGSGPPPAGPPAPPQRHSWPGGASGAAGPASKMVADLARAAGWWARGRKMSDPRGTFEQTSKSDWTSERI
jgi:hypothetical protein